MGKKMKVAAYIPIKLNNERTPGKNIKKFDEFIEEVERLLEMPQYREMTFRIVAKDMHRVLNGSKGRAHWKDDLASLMDINK